MVLNWCSRPGSNRILRVTRASYHHVILREHDWGGVGNRTLAYAFTARLAATTLTPPLFWDPCRFRACVSTTSGGVLPLDERVILIGDVYGDRTRLARIDSAVVSQRAEYAIVLDVSQRVPLTPILSPFREHINCLVSRTGIEPVCTG